MKYAELMALRNRLIKNDTLASAIRMLLNPPIVRPVPKATAVLNKMTPDNYAKLSPIILDAQSEDVARDVMKAAIQQSTFNRVYVDLLKSMRPHQIDVPFDEFLTFTREVIQTIDQTLAQLSETEDYDDFCNSLKHKNQFIARFKFLVLSVDQGLVPKHTLLSLCDSMASAVQNAKHDLGIETFLESMCVCAQSNDDALHVLTNACQQLVQTRTDLSFKVKFKCEKAVEDVVSIWNYKKAE